MKLTVVLWFAAFLQVSAASYAQRINLNVKNAPLKEVLTKIGEQSGFSFIYNSEMIKVAKPVNLSVADELLPDVLTKCFQNQPLTYVINGNTVVIKKKDQNAVSLKKAEVAIPPITVTGTVKDSKGQPLPGVSIRVKGTTTGIVTNVDGKYSIQLPDGNSTLTFSFIGFTTQEVAVNKRTQIDITLLDKPSALNEVIVVGYGTQKKSDITGSITSVNREALSQTPAANLAQALQGQAAGVDITNSGGSSSPGSTPNILIRGQRSVNASNSPLLIVDGIPFNGSFNDINTDDVQSVEILKDASATAIYGSRGANGVLLITTKRGKNGKPVVTYSGYAGYSKPIAYYDMLNGNQFATYRKWALIIANPGKYTGLDDPKFLTDGSFAPDELEGIQSGRSTDWQKLILKSGLMTNHQLGVTGGSESTSYAFSGGYYKESGVYPGQDFSRYSMKLSIDQQLGKYVKIGLNSLNTVTYRNGENAAQIRQVLQPSPLGSPYTSTGVLASYIGNDNLVYNPLANLADGASVELRKRINTFNSLYGEVQIWGGLRYRLNAGAELHADTYGNFYEGATTNNLGAASTASNQSGYSYSYTVENLLLYNKTFKKHNIGFTGLYSLQEYQSQLTGLSYSNVAANFIQYYNPSLGANLTGNGDYQKWDILSYMGRLNYGYDNKYLLTATVRSDGSSRLAPGNKYHLFPSASVAWNISQESFLNNVSFLSNLKLRVSYGQVGNTSVNPYQTLGGLSSIPYNYGSTNTTAVYTTSVPNPKLTWEYTSTLNFGIDFGFFKDRISGSAEVYQQKTNSLLLPQQLPPTSGIPNSFLVNIGNTQNNGLEFTLNTINIQAPKKGAFGWSTNFNIFLNRGKLTSLYNGITQDIANDLFVGQPVRPIFDYTKIGIWQNTPADIAQAQKYGLTVSGTSSVIGQIKLADINGDGKLDANDRSVIGSNQPKIQGGITNHFEFKGVDLSFVVFARIGGMITSSLYNGNNNTLQGRYNSININYWTPTNPTNDYPKPNYAQTLVPFGSTMSYFDGSFVKIRSINLGYTFPKLIYNKIGAKSLRVFASAVNPFIFSKYSSKYHGIDPETGSSNNYSGSLGLNTPTAYTINFGLNATF
ncbi:MAG: TonB-dependent receptor [Mucilaginibacter sp.]|uniref:TonB-dependent receptor n=1 Tax=Mucilaginibacter sp. TaxID=1882438 RepID=UPI0034E3F0BA